MLIIWHLSDLQIPASFLDDFGKENCHIFLVKHHHQSYRGYYPYLALLGRSYKFVRHKECYYVVGIYLLTLILTLVQSYILKQTFSFYLQLCLKVRTTSRHSAVFFANFEHISHFDQVFQLFNLIK